MPSQRLRNFLLLRNESAFRIWLAAAAPARLSGLVVCDLGSVGNERPRPQGLRNGASLEVSAAWGLRPSSLSNPPEKFCSLADTAMTLLAEHDCRRVPRNHLLGGRSSPASQPTASVFIGSTGKDTFSTRSQLLHSNVRSSTPFARGATRANLILCLQAGHIGRSAMKKLAIPVPSPPR